MCRKSKKEENPIFPYYENRLRILVYVNEYLVCSLTYCFDTILGSACVCACFQRTQKCPPNFLWVEKNLKDN